MHGIAVAVFIRMLGRPATTFAFAQCGTPIRRTKCNNPLFAQSPCVGRTIRNHAKLKQEFCCVSGKSGLSGSGTEPRFRESCFTFLCIETTRPSSNAEADAVYLRSAERTSV